MHSAQAPRHVLVHARLFVREASFGPRSAQAASLEASGLPVQLLLGACSGSGLDQQQQVRASAYSWAALLKAEAYCRPVPLAARAAVLCLAVAAFSKR